MKRALVIVSIMVVAASVLAQTQSQDRYDAGRSGTQSTQQQGRDSQSGMQGQSSQYGRETQYGMQGQSSQFRLIKGTDLIGMDVKNLQDESLGNVKDAAVDSRHNAIVYLAVETGGFLGMGDTLVPVQWNQIQVKRGADDKVEHLVWNKTKDEVDKMQGFSDENWPSRAQQTSMMESSSQQMQQGQHQMPSRSQIESGRDLGQTTTDIYGSRQAQDRARSGSMDPSMQSQQSQQQARDRMSDSQMGRDSMGSQMGQSQQYAMDTKLSDLLDMDVRISSTGASSMGGSMGQSQMGRSQTQTSQDRLDQTRTEQQRDRAERDIERRTETMAAGESNGKIQDISIDPNGRLLYAIIDVSDVEGVGIEHAAVPMRALRISPQQEFCTLSATPQQLAQAEYREDDRHQLADRSFGQRIDSIFGQEPYWQVYGYREGGAAMDEWSAGSAYNRGFDAKNVKSYRGEVIGTSSFRPGESAREGMVLKIRTEDGQTRQVHVGPQDYLQSQNVQFNRGTQVTVMGAETQVQGEPVILATSIQSDGRTIELRDRQGTPRWESMEWQQQQGGMQQQGGSQQMERSRQQQDQWQQQREMQKDQMQQNQQRGMETR